MDNYDKRSWRGFARPDGGRCARGQGLGRDLKARVRADVTMPRICGQGITYRMRPTCSRCVSGLSCHFMQVRVRLVRPDFYGLRPKARSHEFRAFRISCTPFALAAPVRTPFNNTERLFLGPIPSPSRPMFWPTPHGVQIKSLPGMFAMSGIATGGQAL